MNQLSARDQKMLRSVFFDETDKDEVCRELGVDRQYLRVLLHRAKNSFRTAYNSRSGASLSEGATTAEKKL